MEILLLRMKYTHEIVGTHGGALLQEQNPSCVAALKRIVTGYFKRVFFMRVSVEHDGDTFVRFEKKVYFEIRTRGKFNGFFIIKQIKKKP